VNRVFLQKPDHSQSSAIDFCIIALHVYSHNKMTNSISLFFRVAGWKSLPIWKPIHYSNAMLYIVQNQ